MSVFTVAQCLGKDLTGQTYDKALDLKNKGLDSLEGSPLVVDNYYSVSGNKKLKSLKYAPEQILAGDFGASELPKLESLEFAPKYVNRFFWCMKCPNLKNVKQQIIMYQIKARGYKTDEGSFSYEDIKEEFEAFNRVKSKGFRTLLGLGQ